MNAFLFGIWTLSRGFIAIITKKAQALTKSSFINSIYFVFIYVLSQFIILISIPPYKNFFNMEFKVIIYPILFGIFYIISYMTLIMAIGTGPTALTNIIYTFHTVIPLVTGIILWKEQITYKRIIGIILVIISVILFYNSVKGKKKRSITLKWLLYVIVATVSIGIAVVFTQSFSKIYPDSTKLYLTLYTLTATIISAILLIAFKSKSGDYTVKIKRYYIYIFITAVLQNIVNYIFMYFINIIPSVILFPSINCIYILTFVVMGRLFLNEKLNRFSLLGVVSSIISLILLNI